MVRILWHYKPKISRVIYFKKWGRVSQVTNRCLNSLISAKTGFESEVIKTGNAGEHAMTLRLARMLPYASGYAVEPQELISILEMFGGMLPAARSKALKHGVEIFQIETANPHIHEEKGKQHLKGMLSLGLGALYYSPLCAGETKKVIIDELQQQGAIGEGGEPPQPRIYPPLKKVDLEKFAEIIQENMTLYSLPEEKH
jgi:mannosyl-3-phosphoglycerate synthase